MMRWWTASELGAGHRNRLGVDVALDTFPAKFAPVAARFNTAERSVGVHRVSLVDAEAPGADTGRHGHPVVGVAGPDRAGQAVVRIVGDAHRFVLVLVADHGQGLVGPWYTPDLGELPAKLNPGGIGPWGISNFQIFPNLEILIYGGWYLLYRYWPTSHNTHRFEAYTAFHPARSVRERIEHEVAAVVLKEFALQDAGMLGGTQAALETGIVDDFPLNDQEILVRTCTRWSVTGCASINMNANR
jgi:hypothetical protein